MAQLTVKNLCPGYDGVAVAQDINFELNRGDYLCIVGENGSGKSTLVKTLAGLTKPVSGQIICGDNFELNQIGYLPQQTLMQKDFPASVGEIVLSGCLAASGFKPFYSAAQKKLALSSMERLGIDHMKNRCYRDLSGGQQQRVLLARALCTEGKMLLLDEPATGLDPAATAEMYTIVKDLNEKEKITIIMVSHDIEAAVKYASHILHLGSQLQFFGTREEYVKSPIKMAFRHQEGLAKLVDEPLCSRAAAGRNRRYFK